VRVLTTLALPDSGRAAVAGIDIVRHPAQVRRYIGVAAQDATLDRLLTGRQNLVLVGELSGMGRQLARARATELLEQFELTGAADRVVNGYSGGMRRRLDVAASLMGRPPVLFLDEPTTCLDPASRQQVWEATLTAPSPDAVATVAPLVSGPVQVSGDGRRLGAGVDPVPGLATSIVRALDRAGIVVDNVEVRQPSLDDVFFALTGDHLGAGTPDEPDSGHGAGQAMKGARA
jgi:ABC transporter